MKVKHWALLAANIDGYRTAVTGRYSRMKERTSKLLSMKVKSVILVRFKVKV